jgi:hypothetical protein
MVFIEEQGCVTGARDEPVDLVHYQLGAADMVYEVHL